MTDLAGQLALVPPGGTWGGNGGVYTTTGVTVAQPMTLEGNNSTFYDPTVTQPTVGYGTVPVLQIKDTEFVTASDLTMHALGDGGFHGSLVGEEGIRVLSSDHVTLRNIHTVNTFGDGLTLAANQPKDKNPVTNLVVENYTISGTGRMGVTVGSVVGATFNNVVISGTAENSWDFESDLPGVGAGNITVNGGSCTNGVRLIEALQGPVTFNNHLIQRHVSLLDAAAASGQLVTINGGVISLPAQQVGILVNGPGNLVFNNVTINRLPSSRDPAAPAWSVTNGGHLTLNHCTLTPQPLGTNDASSTVTITP